MNKKEQILTYNELRSRLNNITRGEHRVFLKTTYATLGRVGEIVRGRYSENPPLEKNNFEATDNMLIINLLTEKTNRIRRVPVARVDDPSQEYFVNNEAWLSEDINNYAQVMDKYLWNKSTRWGEYIFEKYFPEYKSHIHLLRHFRASHLLQGVATGKPVPERVVAKMGGWVGTKTLTAIYDNSIVEDYVRVDRK